MNFVYGIVCHQVTNPLIFLVKKLMESENSIILMHVDKKTDIEIFKNTFKEYKSIYWIEDRIDVKWGSYSQIEATLKLLNKAQEFDYCYFSLLSGDDIALKPVSEIESCLLKNKKEFLGHDIVIKPFVRVKYKYPKFYFGKTNNFIIKLAKVGIRILHKFNFLKQDISKLPPLYKGTNWFTLSKLAVDYIFEYLRLNPYFDNAFRNSFCADEVYFHTIIYNSIFKQSLNLDYNLTPPAMALRYIDWKSGPDYPRTLDQTDFKKMKNSDMFFARKVRSDIPLDILEENF